MNRHPDITRTVTVRDCPHCEGTGEVIRNEAWNADPQCEYPVSCDKCSDGQLIEWRDPLVLLATTRRHYKFRHFYDRARSVAMRPVSGISALGMAESAIRMSTACDAAVGAWRRVAA